MSGGTAEAVSATPLINKVSSVPVEQPAEQPSTHGDLQTQISAGDSQKVAFKLGGSEDADLDKSDAETKDSDAANGENISPLFSFFPIHSSSLFRILRHCCKVPFL